MRVAEFLERELTDCPEGRGILSAFVGSEVWCVYRSVVMLLNSMAFFQVEDWQNLVPAFKQSLHSGSIASSSTLGMGRGFDNRSQPSGPIAIS